MSNKNYQKINISISQQVYMLKKEIQTLQERIECSSCGRMLAGKTPNGDIIIKCRCGDYTLIKTSKGDIKDLEKFEQKLNSS